MLLHDDTYENPNIVFNHVFSPSISHNIDGTKSMVLSKLRVGRMTPTISSQNNWLVYSLYFVDNKL